MTEQQQEKLDRELDEALRMTLSPETRRAIEDAVRKARTVNRAASAIARTVFVVVTATVAAASIKLLFVVWKWILTGLL